jgi:xanthine dehydrogenase accessory factor
MSIDAESVVESALSWLREGRRVVLATVIHTWSSSPRPVGSQMAIDDTGRFEGSVSGGCVETAVIDASREVLEKGGAKTLEFGVGNELAWEIGLACGGQVQVFVRRAELAVMEALGAARQERAIFAVLTDLGSGRTQIFREGAIPEAHRASFHELALAPDDEAATVVELAGERAFLQLIRPPMRLMIVGAVHLTQVLAQLATLCGFRVSVIDPRAVFATAERFPDVEIACEWPESALEKQPLDERTAFVTLSHDPKLDEPALAAALKSKCFYIGALGGKRTQEARRARLMEAGFSERDLARIHGPVGLPIGAQTTAEIAISIMAEVIERRRKRA